jgi:hypothetical protein
MPDLFEKLIDTGAWASLSTPMEKIIVAWFTTKHPQKSLRALRNMSITTIAKGIGASKTSVAEASIQTLMANAQFKLCYATCLKDDGNNSGINSGNNSQSGINSGNNSIRTKEKGKEEERKFSPQTPFIKKEGEKGKESVCADGTLAHSHDAIQSSKQKKQQQQEVPSVVLREPQAFNRFYQLYPKKSKMRQEKEKLKRLWHQCELDGWPGDVIVQALEAAIRSERWTEKEGLYKPNAFKFLEEELMRDFLPIGYAPTPLVDASEENAEAEAHPGMIYKLGVWWTPEELQAYADSMIIPERLKGKVQI